MDIQEKSQDSSTMLINSIILQKLTTALNECTEWGQITILDALADYEPKDSSEAERIIEKVTPRLQHANGAVVLSAVKVLVIYTEHYVESNEIASQVKRKIAPPLGRFSCSTQSQDQ